MLEVEIGVVAHPSRRELAMHLGNEVGASCISWDMHGMGAKANHEQAWTYLMSSPAKWAIILEDDAVPVENFRDQLDQVLAACPGKICSLYLGRGRPDQWQLPIASVISQNVCFLHANTLLSNVGYAVYTPLLEPLYVATRHSYGMELASSISRWARKKKRLICYARPSIVDHLDGPSMIPDSDREDGQSRAVAPHPSGTAVRKAWLFDARESWDSSWAEIPPPDLRRRDKVSRHLVTVHHPDL